MRVQSHDPAPPVAEGGHGEVDRGALQALAILQQTNARRARGHRDGHVAGSVTAAAIGDHDERVRAIRADLKQQRAQMGRLVQARDHHQGSVSADRP